MAKPNKKRAIQMAKKPQKIKAKPKAKKPNKDKKGKDGLTGKESLFVMYYCGVAHFNGSKAARMAGYSEASARELAHRMLTKVDIQKAINAELGNRAANHEDLVTRIISEYMKLAFGNITNAVEFNSMLVKLRNGDELPAEITAAIKTVSMTETGVKIELQDKKGALDSLAKIMGMMTDDFRVRDDKHENIVERLYKKKMAERQNGKA